MKRNPQNSIGKYSGRYIRASQSGENNNGAPLCIKRSNSATARYYKNRLYTLWNPDTMNSKSLTPDRKPCSTLKGTCVYSLRTTLKTRKSNASTPMLQIHYPNPCTWTSPWPPRLGTSIRKSGTLTINRKGLKTLNPHEHDILQHPSEPHKAL